MGRGGSLPPPSPPTVLLGAAMLLKYSGLPAYIPSRHELPHAVIAYQTSSLVNGERKRRDRERERERGERA
jgi:hypothetical protein